MFAPEVAVYSLLDPIYTGPPFTIFSFSHIAALGFVALACVAIAIATFYSNDRQRAWLRRGLIGFTVVNWLGWDAWQLAYGLWSAAFSLPLHLCTLSVPLSALMLLTRSYTLFQLLYFWGFTASVVAMLTPDLAGYGYNFPHFRYWIFFTSHGSILLAVVYAAVAFRYRPTWRSVGLAVLLTNAYLLVAALANWLTGGNYVYIARKPDFPTLIDVLGPWPWYIIPLQLIGIAAFVLVYLPWAARDRVKAWREQSDSLTV
jgi:hypothetical integral membrane protein (TIGR02206 family)